MTMESVTERALQEFTDMVLDLMRELQYDIALYGISVCEAFEEMYDGD